MSCTIDMNDLEEVKEALKLCRKMYDAREVAYTKAVIDLLITKYPDHTTTFEVLKLYYYQSMDKADFSSPLPSRLIRTIALTEEDAHFVANAMESHLTKKLDVGLMGNRWELMDRRARLLGLPPNNEQKRTPHIRQQ